MNDQLFSLEERGTVLSGVLELARSDSRVVAAAVIGSLADGDGDRWSDVDVTFAVKDDVAISEVLADWDERLAARFDAMTLFDLARGETTYRVFLLPRGLQVDLSFTPSRSFRPGGPRFRLLFGDAAAAQPLAPPNAADLYGWAVAYARGARACIERGRVWQAEHEIHMLRDNALSLACIARNLPASYGRGYDDLPSDLLRGFASAVPTSLSVDDLLAALAAGVAGLLDVSEPLLRDVVHRSAPRIVPWVAPIGPSTVPDVSSGG